MLKQISLASFFDGNFPKRPKLKASDTVFMTCPETQLYEVYSGTVVCWAGRAKSKNLKDVREFHQQVKEAHKRKLRYCGNVDFVCDFAGFIDFRPENFAEAICCDLDGNPITVPWLWDHKHKGHPAYWFCTNNPDYQAYLLDQVERACVAPIDGLHIDDWRGTSACSGWNGGCFCHYCVEGFRNWLKRKFSHAELEAMGIDNIEKFDLRSFLKAKGVTAEDWRKSRPQLPFGELFQKFQTEQMLELVRKVFEYAEKLRGKPLLRSVNSSASSPEALSVAPLIDFFCGEMNHYAASTTKLLSEPAFVFRLVEGLGKPQSATAAGHDWAWIAANEKPGLVRVWIAQAYAFGNTFMIPHHQWCYTPEKGTHWWSCKPEDLAFVYRFVRENAKLLDDYRSLANLAIIYTHANFEEIRMVAVKLLEANVPFAIVIAEPSLVADVSAEQLKGYDFLLVGNQPLPPDFTKQIPTQNQVIRWHGFDGLPERIRHQVVVKGSEKVRVSLRYKLDNPKAPIVCHLLNQDYDFQIDDVRPVDVSVSISLSLLKRASKRIPKFAILHVPNQQPQKVSVQVEGDMLNFSVIQLGFWAIVEFTQ
ncbi:MAG: beta-galactosidase [Armatimonadetes bacterium]|nr:beta-galactosidase [Armatimonadota bacterium]